MQVTNPDRRPPPPGEDDDDAPRTGFLRSLFSFAKHLVLWLALALVAYWAWLDHDVSKRFRARQWSLPARIYAAPIELYAGQALGPAQLAERLADIGYVKVESVNGPGQFSLSGSTMTLNSRGFTFPDGQEPPREVVLYFGGNSLKAITGRNGGGSVALVRLDPLEIGRFHTESFEDRVPLEASDLPEFFVQSLLAVEDRRFATHVGVDVLGILRAMVANVRRGEMAQGGSTLTQQLAKNLFLTRERKLRRKLKEVLIALSLERSFSKQEILEAYVNEIFLGQDGNRAIHGFGLAARFYFGRPLEELGVGEQALLIGLVRGPSQYSPFRFPERALERRNVVLARLNESGLIDDAAFDRLKSQPLQLRAGAWRGSNRFAGFLDLVGRQLRQDYQESDLTTAGLKIFTTLDVAMQRAAEAAVRKVLGDIERERPRQQGKLQAAMLVSDPRTADLKAMVGGREDVQGSFNRALEAQRQIGSLMKPFVYLTALRDAAHFNLATRLEDEPRTWRGGDGKAWSPQNYDKRAHGPVPLDYALANSLNLATLDLASRIGIPSVVGTLHAMGVEQEIPSYPSVALGAVEMTPYDVTQLYQALANDGYRSPLRAIKAVVDAQGNLLERNQLKVRRVVDAPTAFLIRYGMTRVVETGTARSLALALPDALPLAGKTGTSDDGRDSWFAGYGTDSLAVAWIGRDDNKPINLTGATGALRIWIEAMRLHGIEPVNLEPPPEIEWHRVSRDGSVMLDEACGSGVMIPLNIEQPPPLAPDCEGEGAAGTGEGAWDNLQRLLR